MIFRDYNPNPVIDARPRWQGCTRSSFARKEMRPLLLPLIRAHRLISALVAAAFLSLCVFSAATAQERLEPSDIWYRGFLLVQSAQELEAKGKHLEALNKLNEAKPLYDHLFQQFPDFQPSIVRERRHLIDKKCDELQVALGNFPSPTAQITTFKFAPKTSRHRWGFWMIDRIPSPDLLSTEFRESEWRNNEFEESKPIASYIAIGIGPFGAVYLSTMLSAVLLILFVALVATLILKRKHGRANQGRLATASPSPAT